MLEPSLPLPHKVITDGTRLRQILWNLISNAVKFAPQGGGVNVRVRYDEGDILHFEVEDSGIGIPEAEQDKIFAMYYRVKDSHGGKPATGTGIGLAVSRRLARNMGGDISVTSQPGKGGDLYAYRPCACHCGRSGRYAGGRRHAITGAQRAAG